MKRSRSNLLLGAAIGMSAIAGCGNRVPIPPPEAVLAGAWLLTSQDSGQNNKLFIFDSAGRLIEIRTTMGNNTFVDRDVHDTTRVDGQNVFIRTRGNLIFEGTLSDDLNVITGSLRTEIDIIFTNDTLITELGPATLTRQ